MVRVMKSETSNNGAFALEFEDTRCTNFKNPLAA